MKVFETIIIYILSILLAIVAGYSLIHLEGHAAIFLILPIILFILCKTLYEAFINGKVYSGYNWIKNESRYIDSILDKTEFWQILIFSLAMQFIIIAFIAFKYF